MVEFSRLKQNMHQERISLMDNCTKKLLGLTDKNLIFEEDWLVTKQEAGITTNIILAKLSYTPPYCRKCGIKNEGQIIIQTMNKYHKTDSIKYKRLKRFWKLFLKNSYNLDSSNYRYNRSFRRPMTEKEIMDDLLSYNDQLSAAYEICQLLLYHFRQKDTDSFFDTINTMDIILPEWFRKKLTFLNKYKQGIQNAFETKYNNGALEGTNNKIKVIKRVAYGYRNFFNFRARIYIMQGLIFTTKNKSS